MFTKFLSRVKAVPPRGSDWATRLGPAALMGNDCGIPMSSRRVLNNFYRCPPDSDFYAELTFHENGPIECPPETVIFIPVLKCGEMLETNVHDTAPPTDETWHAAVSEATSNLIQKGYTPISVGGDGRATQSMLETHKGLFPEEDVILMHFSAKPQLDEFSKPISALLEKGIPKGVISVGNRCVSSTDRKLRREYKVYYLDMQAIFAKGLSCIQDIRNDYPIFISINMDVLDPAFAPGVHTPIPGGLSTRELLHIIAAIRGPKVVGVDIHGYDPELDIRRGDGIGLTEMAAAKVLKEVIVKSAFISTMTKEEAAAKAESMQAQGASPYPDH